MDPFTGAFSFISVLALSEHSSFQPFFSASHPIHDLFPSRDWAIRIPAFLLVVGLSVIGLFVGSVVMKEKAKKNAKMAAKSA